MKLAKTLTMISAAEVITRALVARPVDHRLVVVLVSPVVLADPGEQEHLVVHREPEEDREHQQRHEAD